MTRCSWPWERRSAAPPYRAIPRQGTIEGPGSVIDLALLASRGGLEHEAVGVVEETIADGVGQRGLADEGVPLSDGELAGQDGGAGAVPVVQQFEEVPAILRGEGVEPPIID